MRSLLAPSDVMCTGHHAALSAGVRPGSVVAGVGDGAVGLCAVLAARRLGAERIIALSGNLVRQGLARSFGATDILADRGEEATKAVLELTDGVGVDAVRRAKASGAGRIRAGGLEQDVTFAEPAPSAHTGIDAAYHAKYDRYEPEIEGTVVGPQAESVAIRLVPSS